MYYINEILIANKTARSKGSSVFDTNGNLRSVVANYVINNINKEEKILDFGCGKAAVQANYLRNIGFDGSGEHCGAVDGYSEQEIDSSLTFDFIGDGMDNYWEIDHQLHLSKRAGMPFLKMCHHIYAMIRAHIFRCPIR